MLDLNELTWINCPEGAVDGLSTIKATGYGFEYFVNKDNYWIQTMDLKSNLTIKKDCCSSTEGRLLCQVHHNQVRLSIENYIAKMAHKEIPPTTGRVIDLTPIPPPLPNDNSS